MDQQNKMHVLKENETDNYVRKLHKIELSLNNQNPATNFQEKQESQKL